jgi:hypothetical protein
MKHLFNAARHRASLFVIVCCLGFISSKAYSQITFGCMEDLPSGPGWTQGPCIPITIAPNCVFEVCYCVRYIDPSGNNIPQYSVRSIKALNTSGCSGIHWQQVITEISRELARVLTPNIRPCTEGWTIAWDMVTSMCWEVVNTADPLDEPEYVCIPCPDATGYCKKIWKFCYNGSGYDYQLVSKEWSSPTCELDPPSFDWEPGVCYTINVCDL